MHKQYILELSPAAKRDIKRLPLYVQKKIAFNHLPIIQKDPIVSGTPLTGTLKGERSYHFGRKPEYRIIFYIEDNIITVTIIGTRENVYKRAKRRKKCNVSRN
jgi:mRNA-degrading endonuclease RelE of RelBE toxin-antitoxin system